MSKALLQFRTAFIGLVVLLQLFLLPATHVLHLGCQHPSDHRPAATVSVFDAVEAAWNWCSSSHCCDHCSKTSAKSQDSPTDSGQRRAPHDEHSCPVCQAVCAPRIASTVVAEIPYRESVCEFLYPETPVVDSIPRYSVLSRGPPVSSAG
ncbi:MAG: hypothetical protein KDA89_10085 [Planctomycetaceae bacterium]|nr:hypothetical protein [Planctomycetaceae bacterium]